jgi:hypothetical protein
METEKRRNHLTEENLTMNRQPSHDLNRSRPDSVSKCTPMDQPLIEQPKELEDRILEMLVGNLFVYDEPCDEQTNH